MSTRTATRTARLRHPEGAWGWGAGVAALAVGLGPQALVLAVVPEARTTLAMADTAGLLLDVVAVASGIYMYLHYRLTSSDSTAWLAIGLIFVGVLGLTVTGIRLATASQGQDPFGTVVLADLLAVGTLLGMVLVSERSRPRVDPAAAGLLLGFAGSALAIAAATAAGTDPRIGDVTPWIAMAVVVVGTIVALELRRLVTLPTWARDRLAVAVVAIFAGRATLAAAAPDATAVHLTSTACSTLATVLLLGTSLATLRLAIHDDRVVIAALQEQLAATTASARTDRERLHEVKGTIAGIASASRLIHHDPPIPGPSRALLEEMLERESARLQRLVQADPTVPSRVVEIDDVLRPLVVSRQAQGQDIVWQPTGLRVWGHDDDLAEVLNILLENTARHAPEATVSIHGRPCGARAQIVVADTGPGIPPEQREAIFRRGARGTGSGGEGLGLFVAHRIMIRSGGYLRLDESWHRGAAFVVGATRADLSVNETSHDHVDHVVAQ